MFEDLKLLENNDKIYKKDILEVLKKWAKKISIFDIMDSTYRFREACKHVHEEYKGHFDDIYIKNFYMRVKDIVKDNNDHNQDYVNKKLFLKSVEFFQNQYNQRKEELGSVYTNQGLIYYLICIYTT